MTGKKTVSDFEKGKIVQHQLRVWDTLLEGRIKIQKAISEVNKLPQDYDYWTKYLNTFGNSQESTSNGLNQAQKHISKLIDSLLDIKELLIESNEETVKIIHGNTNENEDNEIITSSEDEGEGDEEKNDDEEEIIDQNNDEDSLGENESIGIENEEETIEVLPNMSKTISSRKRLSTIEDYEIETKRICDSLIPYRDKVIQKWNDRTQPTVGKMNKKILNTPQIPTLQQIEQVLCDKDRLLRRTQLNRTPIQIIGKEEDEHNSVICNSKKGEDYDSEIFDDGDFYHQLLRELIERKTSSITDPVQLSRHWLELQKLRTKTKIKVDTKASKARKIRYEVFPKLVNLMSPLNHYKMTDHAINELFSSLFSSNKE